ncbi:MAG: Tic20 family protein [Scytonema sp. PMC 1069.18]|nr:Tic20 family protein [Scytonema sp. PMC 1069.18]MEC4883355.1 Tic20 family protein [Scytonema sp. PMC 1070.18]
MVWRGRTTMQHRLLSCLPYILPLIQVYGFGLLLFQQIPFLQFLFLPLVPFMALYAFLGQSIPLIGSFIGLAIFFALYLLVVRNEKIAHFIRFHTLQALLLGIFASLCQAVLELVGIAQQGTALSIPLLGGVLYTVIFLAVVAASVYSIVQAIRGVYAEIPVISQAAYSGTRD